MRRRFRPRTDDLIEPPRPLPEMTKQEMADWAREDPERARRFIEQQEQLIRERQRQSQPPAIVTALNRSVFLVVVGLAVYMPIRGYGLFSPRLTWTQTLAVFVAFLIVWLVLWALIHVWRSRIDRHPFAAQRPAHRSDDSPSSMTNPPRRPSDTGQTHPQ